MNEAIAQPAGGTRFFEGADFGRRLHLLQHLSQSSDLVLVVSGPAGSGKSTLLARLLAVTDERWRFCTVRASAEMRPNDVLRQLAQCCGLPEDCGETAWTHLLAEQAAGLVNDDRVPVIAVDDAHLLQSAALASLVHLGTPAGTNPKPWHLILFSEPGLEATLVNGKDKLPAISKLHILRLSPLNLEETADYVGHRLEGAALLSADQLKRLHRDSDGLPGKIETLLERYQAAAPGSKPAAPEPAAPAPKPAPPPRPAGHRRRYVRLLGAAVLVVAVGLVLTYQDRINALFRPQHMPPAPTTTPSVNHAQATARLTTPTTQSPTAATVETPAAPAPATPKPTGQAPVTASKAERTAPTPTTHPSTAKPSDKSTVAQAKPDIKPAASTSPSKPEPTVPPRAPATQASSRTAPANMKLPASIAANAAPRASTPAPVATAAAGRQTAASPATKPTAPAGGKTPPTPAHAATTKQPPHRRETTAKTARTGTTHDSAWLLTQNPEHYTMQLVASWHAQTVRKYLREHHLQGDTAMYHVQYHGKTWYVLIFGVYNDLAGARAALRQLPAAVRRDRPWIRRLSAVQTEVRRGHK